MEELLKIVENLQTDKSLTSLDEASVKQKIILQILTLVGWNIFDIHEVRPEYPVGDNKKVDYALIAGNKVKMFIEAKNQGENLEKHQEQLLNYAFRHGIQIAILTNGIIWWFYLPLREGSWEQRRFYVLELYAHSSKEIAQSFVDFLAKEHVLSGAAMKNADNIYRTNQITEALPKAWNQIIRDPTLQGLMTEELVEATEKLCGYKPEKDEATDFLSTLIPRISLPESWKALPKEEPNTTSGQNDDKSITDFDTIVVPAQKEGFQETFIGENCWYAIRISKKMIPKIKYIAAYQVASVSEITHIAPVKSIKQWQDTNKYIVHFAESAKEIGPINLIPNGTVTAPQAPRYTSMEKLQTAKTLDEAFSGPENSITTPKNKKYKVFFDKLRNAVLTIAPNFTHAKALSRPGWDLGIGRSGFTLYVYFTASDKKVSIGIYINVGVKEDNDATYLSDKIESKS